MLSNLQKLALVKTSGARNSVIASLIGASYQAVTSWLLKAKHNQTYEIPKIYDSNINELFDYHKSIVKQQAQKDNIPYSEKAPVYMERGLLNKTDEFGNRIPGDRVIAINTEYLDKQTRDMFLSDIHKTKRTYQVTVRSTVSLYEYASNRAAIELHQTNRKDISKEKLTREILKNFYQDDSIVDQIIDDHFIGSFFTKPEAMGNPSAAYMLSKINAKLRQKHEPATGSKGTALADEIVFQVYPAKYVHPKTTKNNQNTRRNLRRK